MLRGYAPPRFCGHHPEGQAALQRAVDVSLLCTLEPSALAGALLVQHETCFDVSMLRMPCAWGENRDAASRTACHSVIPKQFFSSTLILASGPLSEPVIHLSWRS